MKIELEKEEWKLIKEWIKYFEYEDVSSIIDEYSIGLDSFVVDNALTNLFIKIDEVLKEE